MFEPTWFPLRQTSRASSATCCQVQPVAPARDVLFRIDRVRYDIALKQTEAVLLGKRTLLDEANADLERYRSLTPDIVVSNRTGDGRRAERR